jgi:hypothetical protein
MPNGANQVDRNAPVRLFVPTVRFLRHLSHQIPIVPERVYTTQEAKFMLNATQSLWAACHADSLSAQLRFEEAYTELAFAEEQLRKAELSMGQVRSTLRRSGFGSLLLAESQFPVSDVSGELLFLNTSCQSYYIGPQYRIDILSSSAAYPVLN